MPVERVNLFRFWVVHALLRKVLLCAIKLQHLRLTLQLPRLKIDDEVVVREVLRMEYATIQLLVIDEAKIDVWVIETLVDLAVVVQDQQVVQVDQVLLYLLLGLVLLAEGAHVPLAVIVIAYGKLGAIFVLLHVLGLDEGAFDLLEEGDLMRVLQIILPNVVNLV